jgi:beta-glucosidase
LYEEDVYVGYRYHEKVEVEPLFSFGHGLSYTTFELSDLRLGEKVQVKVRNTGARAGAEVVQVYVAPIASPVERPEKELKGFARVFLEMGAEKVVDVELDTVRATS